MSVRNTMLLLRPYASDTFDTDDAKACELVATVDLGHNIFAPKPTPSGRGYDAAATDVAHDTLGRVFHHDADDNHVDADRNGNPFVALDAKRVADVLAPYADDPTGAELPASAHAYLTAVLAVGTDHLDDVVVALAYS